VSVVWSERCVRWGGVGDTKTEKPSLNGGVRPLNQVRDVVGGGEVNVR